MYQFDPVLYSIEENEFLYTALGKPPIVAMRDKPEIVNAKAVKPILDRVYELEQLREADGSQWVGVEALKATIKIYLENDAKWSRDYTRTGQKAPRFPSLYSYDTKGRPHRGGPGSDTDRVRTYFNSKGERIPFVVEFFPDHLAGAWVAPTQAVDDSSPESPVLVDKVMNRIECKVKLPDGSYCGHTESFNADSRQSYGTARARMSKHLRKATVSVDEHREAHTNEFTS